LSQKMDVSKEYAAGALNVEGDSSEHATENSDIDSKRGRAAKAEPSLSGLRSSENHAQKAMSNMAEPSMAPSATRSGEMEKEEKSLKRTLLGQNRIQGESSPGQESAPKFEKSQDALDFRPTVLHGTRDQTVVSSGIEKESAQLPRDMQTDVIRQIVARMTLRGDGGRPEMQIKLKPEFLGDLRMHVTTENHHVMVRITADSPAVKEMIEQNLQILKSELQQHGLQIDKFDVFVGQENEAWKHRQQQNASHDARRGRQRFSGRRKLDALEEAEAPQLSGEMRKPTQIGMKEVRWQ
jgi:flagellar hook-length control protein FliK